jgi:hypothetical protein
MQFVLGNKGSRRGVEWESRAGVWLRIQNHTPPPLHTGRKKPWNGVGISVLRVTFAYGLR